MCVNQLIRAKAAPAGNGGGSPVTKTVAVILLSLLLAAAFPVALSAHDLIATTASGRRFVLAKVRRDADSLQITIRDSTITVADPIVDVSGFDQLENLVDLRFYQVPQIASFGFLNDCVSLKRLVISFGRVRSLEFLPSMPELELMHLEFCDDWESEYGLPFLQVPLDLGSNPRLEYLAFRICDLKRVPQLLHVPEALEYVDLSYNGLKIGQADAAALESLRGVGRVFVDGNSIEVSMLAAYPNLALESGNSILSRYLAE